MQIHLQWTLAPALSPGVAKAPPGEMEVQTAWRFHNTVKHHDTQSFPISGYFLALHSSPSGATPIMWHYWF